MYYWWTCSNCYYTEDNHKHEVCPKCKSIMTNGEKIHWLGLRGGDRK